LQFIVSCKKNISKKTGGGRYAISLCASFVNMTQPPRACCAGVGLLVAVVINEVNVIEQSSIHIYYSIFEIQKYSLGTVLIGKAIR
jgi:hypothetical protein